MSEVTEGNRQGRDFVHLHIHTEYSLLVDTAGTVQQAVFGMDVEMNEVSPMTVPFGHIAHAPASSVSVCSSSR